MQSILFAVLGLIAGAAGPVAAQQACPRASTPAKLEFELADPAVTHSREYSANDIMDVNQKRSGRVNIGKSGRTMGLTTYRPKFQMAGKLAPVPGGPGNCMALSEVRVVYGFEFHEVLVAKEFPVDSCEYKIVLDHEDTHVAINRTSLDEYGKKMKAALEEALKAPASRPGGNDAATSQAALNELSNVAKPLAEAAQQQRQERNGGIDTKFSYFESFKKCGNWDQGNIWLDGRPKDGAPKEATVQDAMKAPTDTKAAKAPTDTKAATAQPPAAERDTDPFGLHVGRLTRPPE